MDLLFKLGSLLYLAATAILCLDVIILHRFSTYIHVCPMFHCVLHFLTMIYTCRDSFYIQYTHGVFHTQHTYTCIYMYIVTLLIYNVSVSVCSYLISCFLVQMLLDVYCNDMLEWLCKLCFHVHCTHITLVVQQCFHLLYT